MYFVCRCLKILWHRAWCSNKVWQKVWNQHCERGSRRWQTGWTAGIFHQKVRLHSGSLSCLFFCSKVGILHVLNISIHHCAGMCSAIPVAIQKQLLNWSEKTFSSSAKHVVSWARWMPACVWILTLWKILLKISSAKQRKSKTSWRHIVDWILYAFVNSYKKTHACYYVLVSGNDFALFLRSNIRYGLL